MTDFTCSSKAHAFPLFRESERRQRYLKFANFILSSKIFNNDSKLVAFGLKIVNDCLRVEFPTNTFRDLLTPFQNSNFPISIPKVQQQLAKQKVYTLVVIVVGSEFETELKWFNHKMINVAEKFEEGFYDSHLTKCVRIDCLREPLSGLPYCRTTVGGKTLPRLFAGPSGDVYDLFGMAISYCSYDQKTCSISFTHYNFNVPVPHIKLSLDLQTFLMKNLLHQPFISWVYTTLSSSVKLSEEIEEAFRTYWSLCSTEKVFGEPSMLPTYVRFFSDSMASQIENKYSQTKVYLRRKDGAIRMMLTPVVTSSSTSKNSELVCPIRESMK